MSIDDDVRAVMECLQSGWLTMGPRIKAFEEALAEWTGAAHAVTVSNGDAALFLALRGVGIGQGDQVAVSTDAASRAVLRCDGLPTPEVSEITRAVVVPLGEDVPEGILSVEDATEFTSTTPALSGTAAAFSFAEGRPLAVGEGGMVITNDDEVAARVRALRAHAMTSGTWDRHRGHSDSYDVVDVGFNFRMDEPRAALGLARLARLR
jgi:dTDP-4-amino-4,6-dideoxygalactose transaminase